MARLPKKTTRGKKPASPPKAKKQVTRKVSEPEVLSKLDNKKSAIGIVSVEHSGPIPHPAILQGYEDILPGSAERLFKVFEETAHSRNQQLKYLVQTERHKMHWAGIICVLMLGIFAIALYLGNLWLAGGVLLVAALNRAVISLFRSLSGN